MKTESIWKVFGLFLALALLAASSQASASGSTDYEVWAVDQNGNEVYILDPEGVVLRSIDLAEEVNADRPHVVSVSPNGEEIFFANTVSNSVSIHQASTARALAVIENVGKSPHAAQPNPYDSSRAYVFNIAPQGKDSDGRPDMGETITELVKAGETWAIGRRLDLTREPALADKDEFPSRRPVLAGYSADGSYMLVSLFHGGVAAVDLKAWKVFKAWGKDDVRKHATVIIPSPEGEELYVTSGNEKESWLHVFDVSSSRPLLVARHDLSPIARDAHGATVDPVRRQLWVVHRASSNATIHRLDDIRSKSHTPAVIDYVGKTPDLIEMAPDGSRAFVTLRGPDPAPTIPFPLTGDKPGVAIIDVAERKLHKIVGLGDPEKGDFHGVAIVKK